MQKIVHADVLLIILLEFSFLYSFGSMLLNDKNTIKKYLCKYLYALHIIIKKFT